jgi:hypothetical protein
MADRYEVVDNQTSQVVGSYKSRDRAYSYADRKDNAYGAVRCCVSLTFEPSGDGRKARFLFRDLPRSSSSLWTRTSCRTDSIPRALRCYPPEAGVRRAGVPV